MELPLYILDINEDEQDETAVFAVGLVNQPAIERNWMAFMSHEKESVINSAIQSIKFSVFDEEQRILAGFLMLADKKIFRRDDDGSEYNVIFPPESIYKIVNKLSKSGKSLSFNFDHSEQKTESAYLMQHFLINSKMGINTPDGFDKAPDGSWFGFVKVPDEKEWEEAKKRKGFSVEGYFTDTKILDAEQSTIESLKNKLIKNEMNKSNIEKSLGSTLFSKLKKLFEDEAPAAVVELEKVFLADGVTEIKGNIATGEAVTIVVDGAEAPAPDGEHELQDGTKIKIEAGVITEVEAKEEPEMPLPMSEEAVMTAIQTAVATQSAEFAKQVEAIKTAHAAELAKVKDETKSLFEAVKVLASIEDEEPTAADPKRVSVSNRATSFSKVQAIISKMK